MLQAIGIGAALYFVWVNFIKLYMDAYKLRNIPGPMPIPVLGNLDKMALTSVSAFACTALATRAPDDGSAWLEHPPTLNPSHPQ